jgi:hypothetical protein
MKVHFFFDLDKTFAGYALEFYKRIKNFSLLRGRQVLGECSFPRRIDTPELQAADLLSYSIFQLDGNMFSNDPRLKRLLKNKKPEQKMMILGKDEFRQILIDTRRHEAEFKEKGLILHGKARRERDASRNKKPG